MSEAKSRRAEPQTMSAETMRFSISLPEMFRMGLALLMLGGMWWDMKSDMREIRKDSEHQKEMLDERWGNMIKTQDDRWKAQTDANKALNGEQRMQGITLNDIENALIQAGIYTPNKKGN